MKKLLVLVFIFSPIFVIAQYTLNKGYDNIEIRGNITTYYKYRWYPENSLETNAKAEKNLFKLKDARIKLEGSSNKRKLEYELHLDFAKLKDSEQPVLDAYVTYDSFIETTVGFTKIPFSRHSKIAIIYQPWLKRAQIIDEGQHRRDIGLHLKKSLYSGKIQLFGSIIDGEKDLVSDNDNSGNLEYVSRVEIAYPTKMKYRAFDLAQSSVPIFSLGTSFRTSKKEETDIYDEVIFYKINGTKRSYQFDFASMYKGFSFLCEGHKIEYDWNSRIPSKTETLGFLIEGNYLFKKYNSVIAFRYDQTDINGVSGNNPAPGIQEETFSIGYNYRFNEHMNVLKIQFRKNYYPNQNLPSKNEIRIGLQYLIG